MDAFAVAGADARDARAWNKLGSLWLKQGRTRDAVRALRHAVEADPHSEAALHNLGDALTRVGDPHAAALSYCAAYVVRPDAGKPRHMLGIAYSVLGRFDDAAAAYAQWLQEEPGQPVAEHLLAACRGHGAPQRASDGYLKAYFDGFAETFDHKLVAQLDYRVPELVGQALQGLGIAPRSLRVLDAGCGTGLCAPSAAPFASTLTGVDLSEKSLAVAAGKQLYGSLHPCEIVAFMSDSPPAAFDLVVAADTLIYFGDLTAFLHGAAHVLAPEGLLVASFEALECPDAAEAGFSLTPAGRYRHSRPYIFDRLADAGFEALSVTPIHIRKELARAVDGLLVVARVGA